MTADTPGTNPPTDAAAAAMKPGGQMRWLMPLVVGVVVVAIVLAIVWWPGNLPEPSNTANGDNENQATNTAANTTGGPDTPGLTNAEKEQIKARLLAEKPWWDVIRDPKDPAQRFDYMQKMIGSMRYFLQYGAWQAISQPLADQEQARRRQPVYLALRAALTSMTPPPSGTPQGRIQAMQWLVQSLEIDPQFAHGHYLLGYVMMMDLQAKAEGGLPMEPAVLQAAAQHLGDALAIRDDFPDAWGQLAMAYAMLGAGDEALEAAEKAIAADPSNEQNWARYLALLQRFGRQHEMEERMNHLLSRYPATARVRLVVYLQLAEILANSGEFDRSWAYLQLARDAADEIPDLAAEQWMEIECATARVAVVTSDPQPATAAELLRSAAARAKAAERSSMRVIAAWTEVLRRVEDRDAAYLAEALDLCFEAMVDSTGVVTDNDRLQVDAVVTRLTGGNANLAALDQERLSKLLAWALERVQATDSNSQERAIRIAAAQFPIQKDADGKAHIDPARLTNTHEGTLESLVTMLGTDCLESTEYRVTLPGCELLGHLLTAANGRFDSAFASRAREILGRPLNRDQAQRMANVGEVVVRHPMPALGAPVVAALQAAAAADNGADNCRRVFPVLHRALNAIYEPDLEPAWKADGSTGIDEFRRLAAAWHERVGTGE